MLERELLEPNDPVAKRLTELAFQFRVEGAVFHAIDGPMPGSVLADADAFFPSEKASDWSREFLSAAVESVLMWADFHAPLEVAPGAVVRIRTRPVQALARSALEASSQCLWVLDAASPDEMSRRHLRLLHDDHLEQRKAYALQAHRVDGAEEQLNRLRTRLQALSGDPSPKKAPAYVDMIRAAARTMKRDPDTFEFVWRLASASTHGKRWAVFDNNDIEVIEEYEPGQVRTARTPRPEILLRALGVAFDVVQFAVLVYATRSGFPFDDYDKLKKDAVLSLASEIPVKPDRESEHARLIEQLRGRGDG